MGEKSGGNVDAAVRKYLNDGEFEKAEQLCAQIIRSGAGEKDLNSSTMFLLLAQIISGKADECNISLLARNNLILQAVALCHYTLNLCKLQPSSEETNVPEIEKEVALVIDNLQEAMFMSMGVDLSKGREIFNKAKKYHSQLEEIRSYLRQDLESLGNIDHNDLDSEFEHCRKIQDLYKRVGEKMRELLSDMLKCCLLLLDSPPCAFAAVALGSLARLEATPYSDLEWAFLIEKPDEPCKKFFRNLTQLMHFMVINFGETILPSMDIPCLRSWFYDDVTPRGLAFDGALPQACKTPLGKRDDNGRIIYELIGTPDEISKFQRLKWVKVNPQLASVLRTVLMINQDEEAEKLVRLYKQNVNLELARLVAHEGDDDSEKLREALARLELATDFYKFNPRLGQEDQAGKFLDIKKEIYRLMDRLLASVALHFNADGQSAWDCLQWLRNRKILGEKGMRNLFVAVSIGAEMRARAYVEREKQNDYLDCCEFINACQKGLDTAVCMLGVSSVDTMFRYYYSVLPFFSYIWQCALGIGGNCLYQIGNEEFYDESSKYRALINMRFRQYNKARIELQKFLLEYPHDDEAASELGNVLKILRKYPQAASMHSKALHTLVCSNDVLYTGKKLHSLDEVTSWRNFMQSIRSSINATFGFYYFRVHLYNLGICYGHMDFKEKAIDCLQCCVELCRDRVAKESLWTSSDVHDLAQTLNVLGVIYGKFHDDQDLACLEESLNLYAISSSQVTSSAEAVTKYNLGASYYRRGQLHQASAILHDALDQYSYAYGESSDPNVASAQFLLGKVYLCLQQYPEATEILTRCLELVAEPFQYGTSITQSDVEPYLKIAVVGVGMSQESVNISKRFITEVLKNCQEKESIASVLMLLADHCMHLQKPRQAFNLSEKCLLTFREIYGETPSLNYTTCLAILGRSCSSLGKREMSIHYLFRALQNHREVCKMRGKNTEAERKVEVSVMTSLANIYKSLESYNQALEHYHKCLQIQSTMRHDKSVVITLVNLGSTYCMAGMFKRGIVFLEMAFEVVQKILKEEGQDDVVNCNLLSEITNKLCTTLRLCNQSEKISEITQISSQVMDALKKSNSSKLQNEQTRY